MLMWADTGGAVRSDPPRPVYRGSDGAGGRGEVGRHAIGGVEVDEVVEGGLRALHLLGVGKRARPVRGLVVERAALLRVLAVGQVAFLAQDAMVKGQHAASRDLNHVLAAIVDRSDAWNNYAFMARESGEYDKSEAAYRHALEIQPESGQLMNDLGVILHYHKGTPENLVEARKLYMAAQVAAEKVLADANATPEKKAIAQKTMNDAKGNIVAMEKQAKARKAAEKAKQKKAAAEKAAAERAAKAGKRKKRKRANRILLMKKSLKR